MVLIMATSTTSSLSSEGPPRQRLHLQGSFSSGLGEELDMFLSTFEAARQLLVLGFTRNATISVLNALLGLVLQQTESVPVTRSGTSSSGREMMLDSAVKQQYIHSVYVDKLYQRIVCDAVEDSMKAAVDHVNANPDYITSGEIRLKTNFKSVWE
ncbi:hypothetical protein EMCRGX_G005528 [Ephydatia muelleri]